MSDIVFYLIGFAITYVVLKLIAYDEENTWGKVLSRFVISLCSWFTVFIILCSWIILLVEYISKNVKAPRWL
jgi:uncharacterized membrane protein YfhO